LRADQVNMRQKHPTLPPRRRRAFTTIEALIAATILAILTAAVSGALMSGRAQSKMARDTLSASFLAQTLMDEILRLPFNDPQGYTTMGPDPGETRTTFDNVDDYYGYTDGGTATITDLAGNPYPDTYSGFTRSVTMTAISTSPAGWNRTLTGLLVTVTVSKDGSELIRLQRIAWN
jgi:MSHA pilin protein MshD